LVKERVTRVVVFVEYRILGGSGRTENEKNYYKEALKHTSHEII